MAFTHVLDTSALVAALLGEAGADRVFEVLDNAAMSSVNLLETFGKLVQRGVPVGEARARIESLAIPSVPWTEEDVWESGDVLPLAWQKGISLGDRVCLVTARKHGAVAVTADRQWVGAATGVEILLIR